jgi:hypothetical protein
MRNNKLSVFSPPENHLSVDQMYQYLNNQLPVTDRYQVEQHLLDCDLCNDAISGFSLTSKENTERQIFQINYQLKSQTQRRKPNTMVQNLKNWGITTIILFILLLAALLVWFQVKQGNSTNNPKPPATMPLNPASIKTEVYTQPSPIILLKV